MSQPAGDFDYTHHAATYINHRRTDPRIAALVHAALGSARTILNVGAGAGSYEPLDRHIIPIEPSPAMRAQRPPHLAPAINASAESLPQGDQSVDAAMAMLTIHQWSDWRQGLAELRRVTRGPIVILTFDGDALHRFWLADYIPELIAAERHRFQPLADIAAALGNNTTIHPIAVPIDCTDHFTEALYARPEMFLDESVRRSQSAWGFVTNEAQSRFVTTLTTDLANGTWDHHYHHYRTLPTYNSALRLLISPSR